MHIPILQEHVITLKTGLIRDEATDVSTHEQVSVCVMFVESTGGKVILREELLGFASASETTFENLS